MGPVVVDAAGEVFGDAPNVAARVQRRAEPGTVLVTAAVQRQTAGLFVAEDKGAHPLKGVPAPMTLYRIVRASGGGRRGGARALTPLVGREEELELLSRRWERARSGEGQLALIVGEPGIGKSRLRDDAMVRAHAPSPPLPGGPQKMQRAERRRLEEPGQRAVGSGQMLPGRRLRRGSSAAGARRAVATEARPFGLRRRKGSVASLCPREAGAIADTGVIRAA